MIHYRLQAYSRRYIMLQFIQNILRSKPGSVGIIALLLLIPLSLIESKIRERSTFHEQAVAEISDSWTGKQTLIGPVLVVDYQVSEAKTYLNEEEDKFMTRMEIVDRTALLPMEDLRVDVAVNTQKRYRGIHEVQVYSSHMDMSGEYQPAALLSIMEQPKFHQIRNLYILISVSDQRGFAYIPTLSWGDKTYQFSAGGYAVLQGRGIMVKLTTQDLMEPTTFKSILGLKGTSTLNFVPAGRSTHFQVNSDWNHPKFIGRYLPASRTVEDGFSANWSVTALASNINRDLALCASNKCNNLIGNSFGVELIEPVDVYLITERAVKYGLLFVGLVFALVFAGEIRQSVTVHPIQYLMVGVGLSIFFLLLVALSEHIFFNYAYLLATVMCCGLLTWYGIQIFQGIRAGLIFGGVNTALFSLLYVILNTEDIALLLGTLITFAVVTILMIFTRNAENLNLFSLNMWGNQSAQK